MHYICPWWNEVCAWLAYPKFRLVIPLSLSISKSPVPSVVHEFAVFFIATGSQMSRTLCERPKNRKCQKYFRHCSTIFARHQFSPFGGLWFPWKRSMTMNYPFALAQVHESLVLRCPGIGDGPNTVSGSTVWNTELSEFFGAHWVPGSELSEFLSAYYLCAKANSPSFSQNSPSLPQNSVSSVLRNSILETVFRPFPKKPTQNPEMPKRHRVYTNFFGKFTRTFAFFPVTRVRNPTEIVQINLFRWSFYFGVILSIGFSSCDMRVYT